MAQRQGTTHPALSRALVASYALTAYAVGMFGLFWVLLAAGGYAPHGLSSFQTGNPAVALLVNIGLVFAFAFERLGSLLPAMFAHGLGNLLAILMAVAFYR